MEVKNHNNKEWLYQKYMVEHLSINQIAEICNVHRSNVSVKINKFGFPTTHNRSVNQKFWDMVDLSGGGPCWMWKGKPRNDGYGRLRVNDKQIGAHRLSYELHNNTEIPKGKLVCHTCDNPLCVNPLHLFLGTSNDNTQDAVKKGRIANGKRNGAYTHPEKVPKGEKNGLAKLNDNKVRQIRKLHKSGTSSTKLAEMFSMSKSAIKSVLRRETWKHVA